MDAVTVRKNGFAEMAYVGETPWHGLGQELQAGASIETWKAAAGMDWRIQRGVVRYATDFSGSVNELADQHVLFRSDSKEALGIVSKKYKVVQPEVVLEFFRDLTDANGYTLTTAGTLFNGKRFWALASIGEEACVIGEDKVKGYLLFSSSCDGTLPTTAKFTTVRVVCNNTLGMAIGEKGRKDVIVRHSSKFDAELAKQQLGLARGKFGEFMAAARKLATIRVMNTQAEDFVVSLLKDSKVTSLEDPKQSKQYQKIMDLFKGSSMGGSLTGVEGSAWGLVNSVTEFVDHWAVSKTDSHRLSNAWFGRGDDLKTEVLNRAIVL